MIIRLLKFKNLRPVHFKNCSSFYHADNLLVEIPKPESVHRCMLNLIQQRRSDEALKLFQKQIQMGFSEIDEVVITIAVKACNGMPKLGSQVHGFAMISGFMSYVSVCNSLMSMYTKLRDWMSVVFIFENLNNRDTVSYNTVLSGFEDSRDALLFARDMRLAGVAYDVITYTTALAHSTNSREFDFGCQLHCHVPKLGLQDEIFIGNALVTLYAKCGKISEAENVFSQMPYKDLVSWNAILSGYSQEGSCGWEAISVFVEMVRSGMKLDHVSFTSVISACGQERKLDFGRQVQCLAIKRGYGTHVSVCNVLMSLYSKCEILEDAQLVFENIVDPNVVSWTTILTINEEDAVNLFREMRRHGVGPNDVTFVGLIHAITKYSMILEGIVVHGFCIKSNFVSEMNVSNSLITMYGKFKLVEDCVKVFKDLDSREIISWNALISGYSLNEMYQEALQAFSSASKELQPNAYTFGSVLNAIASSESVSLRQGQRCHGYVRKLGLNTDPIVLGALLDMYAKRGSIRESQKIFHECTEKSQVIWTAIISAHSRHGDYESVMNYFKEMVTEGIRPDSITFLSVLTACGRKGMVDNGADIFNSMVRDHSIEPFPEHYSCMVDMLGRAGRLNEAEEVLNQIPGGPGVSVLQSLLGSCKIYGNEEMAMRVADALIEMEPTESGSYILMSNLFAEKGKWERVSKMRRMMRDRKVTKEIGFSRVDVGDVDDSMNLHGFSSADKSHPRSKEIYWMAELLGLETRKVRESPSDISL